MSMKITQVRVRIDAISMEQSFMEVLTYAQIHSMHNNHDES